MRARKHCASWRKTQPSRISCEQGAAADRNSIMMIRRELTLTRRASPAEPVAKMKPISSRAIAVMVFLWS